MSIKFLLIILFLIEKVESELRKQAEEREKAEQQRRRSSRFDQQPLPSSINSPHKIPSLLDPISHPSPSLGLHGPPPPMQMNGPAGLVPFAPSQAPQIGHIFQQSLPQQRPVDLIPKAPYYELPAGMIVPLIRLEDITVSVPLSLVSA